MSRLDVYDELLRAIPAERRVRRCLVGRHWTLVEADGPGPAVGMVMTQRAEGTPASLPLPIAGRRLAEVAALVRSWNVEEAALGLAAVNAFHNALPRVEALFRWRRDGGRDETAFDALAEEIAGRRVAVVGHFPRIERLADRCTLTILERHPQPGDLPDFAAEHVLPDQEVVFLTGTTLVNKTFPRLLELARRARVVLVGPSVPLWPALFERGVEVLGGTVVLDPDAVWQITAEGGTREVWKHGAARVQFRRTDLAPADR